MLLTVDSSGGTGVALLGLDGVTIFERFSADGRGHAEAIGPMLADAVAAGGGPGALTAVAYGVGPGPFTGLRVGMAAARALAGALGLPTLPVVSHDAIAEASGPRSGDFVVVTDAKRHESYFTTYGDRTADGLPRRLAEPRVGPEAQLPDLPRVTAPLLPSALGRVALARRAAGLASDDDTPRYLRSPDVTPGVPKRVLG